MVIVRRIDHIVSLVRDLDAAFDTYTGRLGFPVSWTRSTVDGGESCAVWLGDASLELLQPLGDDSPASLFFRSAIDSGGEGPFMVAFEPVGITHATEELTSRGVAATAPVTHGARNADGDARQFTLSFISRRFTAPLNCFLCEYDPPFRPVDGGKGALRVKKLDHVVIATEDLEDAARLWERNLGLKADASLDKPLGAGFKVARLPIGDAFLELVQPVAKEGRFYEQFQQRGEGIFSISLEVQDLDEAVEYLRGKGIKVSRPEASIWPGARLARINHEYTHGVSIQLIERR